MLLCVSVFYLKNKFAHATIFFVKIWYSIFEKERIES